MNNASEVWSALMNRRVQHYASDVQTQVGGTLIDDVALHVHLDQTGCRHLIVEQPERVEQQMLGILADSYGDVVVDALRPVLQVNDSVESRQLATEQLLALGIPHGVRATDVSDGHDRRRS